MSAVLDSSAILAALNGETGGDIVDGVIDGSFVSTVNIAELATVLSRDGQDADMVQAILAGLPAMAIAPDQAMAVDAGLIHRQTRKAGLSLGDRFCLSLARRLARPVYTADRAWQDAGEQLGVEIRLIR